MEHSNSHTLRKMVGAILLLSTIALYSQSNSGTTFEPLHLVISVPSLEDTAEWYISKLDFEAYKKFVVPDKGLSAQLLRKGNFELMLIKSEDSSELPDSRKNTFSNLAVQGVKRIAFKVENLSQFIDGLINKGVAIDVAPRLFEDSKNNVAFKWAIISDNNGNLIEFVELLKK
ncbi:VOC family protein [Flagellimonas meridianipacifica]|uniref:Glyoxalase/bleomycin resistance protein/dioxygenase superfamily protein n=1 Tax=Flagellimonas meridianipacifica TaxID=1080225 RepID=A0A2T0MCY9_9FLAO|nr:VOC family protein [Allomuricauda pacifica]PRX55368.1 glyoxalase/bleomycin resistance protein/dioxygenase superfamily protein [Allomuricauda pacifica]